VTVAIVADCGINGAGTGAPADLLISHDLVNRNALQKHLDRFRFAGQFATNATNLPEPEGRFPKLVTPRRADDRIARQKKDFRGPAFPPADWLGFRASLPCDLSARGA
jgi:hypothetical protein